jgi:DNA polymerase III epsilon subunit-like protein
MPWDKMSFFDLAEVAHHLGYPMGTTQQQLEFSIGAEGLPANRHRAHADVKVMSQIWKRMLRNIEARPERMGELNLALASENPESAVAQVLLKYDRSLNASRTTLDWIASTKKAEIASRQEIFVLIDTETTGLLPKERSHHDTAVRVIEFGAKILSPYSGDSYEESFESFVNPGEGVTIASEATAVHKITTADLIGKPSMGKVADSFMNWVKTSNTYQRILREKAVQEEPRIVLVGYNNSGYDNALLEEELLLSGIDLKRLISKKVVRSYDGMHLMSTLYTGESKKPADNKMQTHARFLGIPEDRAHRALGDVRTLERILKKICGNINPTLILSAAVKFPGSPGKAAKIILKEAKALLRTIGSIETAVKQSTLAYEESLKAQEDASSSSSAPAAKRRKKNPEPQPASQDFLTTSQPLDGQTELI